jgi:gamma-glutamyl-gamma-aminobutyrate hydrolase PuuD
VDDDGQLLQSYADEIKVRKYGDTNVAEAMKDIDAVFFVGGEDISPSLFKVPVPVDNEGEGIDATRDISDYTYMAYCIDNDIPTLAVCRGEQMMGVVCGATIIQDIPNYYKAQGVAYDHTHRMPPGTPNRDYARHDVAIDKDSKWMYNIVGSTEIKDVSSWHHLAIESVEGTGLTVAASTNVNGIDIIEAVEYQANTFCLGLQFHPENDASLILWDKNPEAAKCDYDTCMSFFKMLVDVCK